MKGLSLLCLVVAGLILITTVAFRFTMTPLVVSGHPVDAKSLLILTNTFLLFSLLFRK